MPSDTRKWAASKECPETTVLAAGGAEPSATRFPTYGAERVWFFVKLRGRVLPVLAFDDQFLVRFPDGTELYVEKADCESPFSGQPMTGGSGPRHNSASPMHRIDAAFERNAGKFEEDKP